jgi:hypothetical protein
MIELPESSDNGMIALRNKNERYVNKFFEFFFRDRVFEFYCRRYFSVRDVFLAKVCTQQL